MVRRKPSSKKYPTESIRRFNSSSSSNGWPNQRRINLPPMGVLVKSNVANKDNSLFSARPAANSSRLRRVWLSRII